MVHNILRHSKIPRTALQITLTHRQLLLLQQLAERRLVTVSWLLRGLLRQHLGQYDRQFPRRPRRFLEPTTRFNLLFHRPADKDFHCSLVHRVNKPVATVLRLMVDDLLAGIIDISTGLLDAKEYQTWTTETHAMEKNDKRCVIHHHTLCTRVKKLDYWAQNPRGYLNLMILGRKNRRNKLKTHF